MRGIGWVDVAALCGLITMLGGVWLWLGVWAAVALLGGVLLAFSVRVAAKAG